MKWRNKSVCFCSSENVAGIFTALRKKNKTKYKSVYMCGRKNKKKVRSIWRRVRYFFTFLSPLWLLHLILFFSLNLSIGRKSCASKKSPLVFSFAQHRYYGSELDFTRIERKKNFTFCYDISVLTLTQQKLFFFYIICLQNTLYFHFLYILFYFFLQLLY